MLLLRCLLVVARKDIEIWLLHPWMLLSSLFVPLTYFLVVFLAAQATGTNPVAVVNLDPGPQGTRMVQALTNADVFRLQVVSQEQAQQLYDHLQVAAIVVIPATLSQQVQANQPATITVHANNYNADLADDIRRAVPDAIALYYQQEGAASPIPVTVDEQPLRPHDIQLFQYSVLPILVLVISVQGIIVSGMAETREWEERTMKELLLAPCPPWVLIGGKVAAGFLTTMVLATVLLVSGVLFGLVPLTGPYWFSALLIIALSSCMSSGLGVAIGALWRRKQTVSYAATIAAVWLFSLSGGIGVIFFEPQWLQTIAAFDPLLYAIHALQQAVFYQSFDLLWRDCLVLVLTAFAAVVLGSYAMKRSIHA